MTTLFLATLFLIASSILILLFIAIKKISSISMRLRILDKESNHMIANTKQDFSLIRDELSKNNREIRAELQTTLQLVNDSLLNRVAEMSISQKNQLEIFSQQLGMLTQMNEQKLNTLRSTIEQKLESLQEDNAQKLEKMRMTVDEKLHETLEKRLGESFQLVSQKLESVHRGLGEMQVLASDVGDLKKVLTNVKTRGTWGEVQLGNLLEQMLTKEQYAKNVATKQGSRDRVEFAIKLPGNNNGEVWLPIDAKFPHEDYNRLIDAEQSGKHDEMENASKRLSARIKEEAKTISTKYLDPPYTTDFAIMFLPTEGLYAEILRRHDVCDTIQREHRVLMTGPTTLAALLNSLQMGFRTLAIEKRSGEVWELLGDVKQHFNKFGTMLDKTKKKLEEAQNTIEDASRKSRTIERKLGNIEEIPQSATNKEFDLLNV